MRYSWLSHSLQVSTGSGTAGVVVVCKSVMDEAQLASSLWQVRGELA